MLDVFMFMIATATALAIGIRLGRRKQARIVGDLHVPLVEAGGQRMMLGQHDMTVANIVISLEGERGPRTASIDLVDSTEWEKKRRVS